METKNNSNTNDNLKKQELLKKEIIDKNLDKDSFLDFCISKKDNGDDLDNWTLEELRNTIAEFSKAENQPKQTKEKNDKNDKKKKKALKEENHFIEEDKMNEIEEQSVKYGVKIKKFF